MNEEIKRPALDEKTSETKVEKGLRDDPFGVTPAARRVMVLYFLIDESGSMAGQKIASVNEVMKDIIVMVGDFSKSNTDAEIRLNVLLFGDGARWMHPAPIPADQFVWQDLKGSGGTDFGAASEQMELRLHRTSDMGDPHGNYVPGAVIMSDGEFNMDWEGRFDKSLALNKWYGVALKRAIAIGNDANPDTLAKVVGSKERVITVHNVDSLKEVLRLTTQGISTIGSTSSLTGSGTKDDELTSVIKDGVDATDGAHFAGDPVTHIEDEWD
jgi:uncharacterized protein YegL